MSAATDKRNRVDVRITGGMGMYSFDLLTDAATAFVTKHVGVEAWQDTESTSRFACDDTRYAMEIADAMKAEGLVVR